MTAVAGFVTMKGSRFPGKTDVGRSLSEKPMTASLRLSKVVSKTLEGVHSGGVLFVARSTRLAVRKGKFASGIS